MKLLFNWGISACLCLVIACHVQAQVHQIKETISGAWSGILAGQIPLIFHFVTAADGSVTGTLDSPDQGAMGLTLATVTVTKDSVLCIMTTPAARYVAARVNDSTLKGIFLQGPAILPLTLQKGLSATHKPLVMVAHPQTPHPPFPYNSDSVTYENADHSIHFGATLTYPKSGGPFPVAILITGSGQQDRDESLLGHKPFAVIADYLSRRGFAILRVDDRGTGLTNGDVMGATSADFAKDVEASMAYLKTRKEVNKAKIGLIGHSEGAMIAPMIAARNKDVAFIVLLASPAVGGYETIMYQSIEPARKNHALPQYIDLATHFEKLALDNSISATDANSFLTGFMSAYSAWTDSIPDSVKVKYPDLFASPDHLKEAYAEAAHSFVSPWWKFFISYPSIDDFKHLQIPVLALNGTQDIQVACSPNLELIQETLSAAGNRHFETRAMQGLNHLFQHCHTCQVAEYEKLEETFAPEALEVIGDWMTLQVGQ